jgi:hypothetical protein
MGETIAAAQFLIEEYGLTHFRFETQRKPSQNFILMTTEGALGEPKLFGYRRTL